MINEEDRPVRRFATLYFGDKRHTKASRAVTRGFPKAEDGSIDGAAKAVAKGYVRKVQCIDRWNHDRVKWTVEAGERVPGVKIVPVKVFKGDHE